MATIIIKTIKSAGGDYTSRSAYEAGEQGDLVTADQVRKAEIYAFADSTSIVVDGSTTDATRYMWFHVVPTDRHAGVYDSAKARVSVNLDGATVNVVDPYCLYEFDQIENTHANGKGIGSSSTVYAGFVVNACIITGAGSGTTGIAVGNGYTPEHTRNCVIKGWGTGVQDWYGSNPYIDNNTIINCGTGIHRNAGTMTVKNCYVGNCTTEYSGDMTRTTCAHSSATVYSGSTASVAYSTANFTNVTAGSENLHLVSGSALIDVGTDLSASFTVDIDGVTRSGTWDIGADEYVAAAGGQPYIKRTGGVPFMARNRGIW